MRVKLNQCYEDTLSLVSGKGYIEKSLKQEVDFLLASSVNELNGVEFDDVYIENWEAEAFLSTLLEPSFSDKILFLTGMTGTGKSMLLRKVFRIHTMSPIISRCTLIVPISFDNITGLKSKTEEGIVNQVTSIFSDMINCACEKIESDYPSIVKVEENQQAFYDFLCSNRGGIAAYSNIFPRLSIEQKITKFAAEQTLTFNSAMLKYYIGQDQCPIDNVVFILDDIEGIGEKNELIPVKVMFEVMTCMQNQVKAKKWTANALISCRHYIFRVIKYGSFADKDDDGNAKQVFETYTEADMYHLTPRLTIWDIVAKRYEAITKDGALTRGEKPQNWVSALEVVRHLLFDIDKNIGGFILNLNLNNIRSALNTVKKVIYNKRWIQRDHLIEESPGAFKITTVLQFDTNYANLIRAIGMGEGISYCAEESLIVNLLKNNLDSESDLFVLLALKYFIVISGNKYTDWNNSVDIDRFYLKLKEIFDEGMYHAEFEEAVHYLLLERVLLRSIDQLQVNTSPVNSHTVTDIKKVYLANAAIDLWKMLGTNSILFEMYVDDIWLDLSHKPTSKHFFRGFDSDNFDHALNYLGKLIECESLIRRAAKNNDKLRIYNGCFGSTTVCEHLLTGLRNSLRKYYRNPDDTDIQLSMWNRKIRKYEDAIKLID